MEGTMRVWLHKLEGDEWGWTAWSFDYLGFATWAPSRSEVLDKAPKKLEEYCQWLARHRDVACTLNTGAAAGATDLAGGFAGGTGLPVGPGALEKIEIVEEIAGNEVAFREDLTPASADEVGLCAELLGYTRRDLLRTVEPLPDEVLDWDPPYRHFASYAWWRAIRQILLHVALTEVAYYLPNIGWRARLDLQALEALDWREQLQQTRDETQRFLGELMDSSDRIRLRGDGSEGETWTVRKVLRRLVWHERLHLKSIHRIVAEYGQTR